MSQSKTEDVRFFAQMGSNPIQSKNPLLIGDYYMWFDFVHWLHTWDNFIVGIVFGIMIGVVIAETARSWKKNE